MIQIICDKCGKDCERNAYEIRVNAIHNPAPLYVFDTGDLKITDDKSSYRFILCQNCYREMGFPNIYKVYETKELQFRDNKNSNKHGHWFLLDDCANEGVYCSVCCKKVYKKNYANQKLKSKFCPNCGAVMDGEFRSL